MTKSKNEFDKDYIYQLIMPSACTEADDSSVQPDASSVSSETPSVNAITSLKQRLFSREPELPASIAAAEKQEKGVINLTEVLVDKQIDLLFERFRCCRCDKCRKDIAAFALNLLPAEYIVVNEDELPELIQTHSTKEISAALVKAVLYVRAHPNH